MVAGGLSGEVDSEEGGEAAGGDHPQGETCVDTGGHPGRQGHQQRLQIIMVMLRLLNSSCHTTYIVHTMPCYINIAL